MTFDIGRIKAKIIQDRLDKPFLSKVDGAISFVFNVDTKEVFNSIICCDGQSSIVNLFNDVIEFLLVWANKDAVISVENIHGVVFVEDTVIMFGNFEPNGFKFLSQVEVPNATRILSTVDVLGDMEDPMSGVMPRDFTTLGNGHVHWPSCRSLRISLNIINLLSMPTVEEDHA